MQNDAALKSSVNNKFTSKLACSIKKKKLVIPTRPTSVVRAPLHTTSPKTCKHFQQPSNGMWILNAFIMASTNTI